MRGDTPDILIASGNPHKVEEIAAVLAPLGVRVAGLDSVSPAIAEPEETGRTFEANAELKALYYAGRTGRVCLADDSGLEVDALGGAPGVASAYYAGREGTRSERDRANNAKLLRAMQLTPGEQRRARFVCMMCLADAQGVLATSRGTLEGRITVEPRGSNGFGYDPLLELEDGRTSAELSPSEKNARSHRGQAARKMAEAIARINWHKRRDNDGIHGCRNRVNLER